MRFLPTRLFLSALSILFFATSVFSQGETCEEAITVQLGAQPTFYVGDINPNSSGSIGGLGCNNFSNLAVQWLRLSNFAFPTVLNIRNDGEGELQVALYQGQCDERKLVQCAVLSDFTNYGPDMFTNIQLEENDFYFLEVAYTDGVARDFQLQIRRQHSISYCHQYGSQLNPVNTSLGSPTEGPYAAGETVTFCSQIVWSSADNDCQYLHGIVPKFGSGWDETSYINGPENFQFSFGTFNWYTAGFVNYNFNGRYYSEGEMLPSGWFMTGVPGMNPQCGPNDYMVDPNCSYGIQQQCGTVVNYQFCFDLTVKQDVNCAVTSDADLSIELKLFADGETGGWTSGGCEFDGPIAENYGAQCCDQIVLSPIFIPDAVCNGAQTNFDLTSLLDFVPNQNDYKFIYEVETYNVNYNVENCFGNCDEILAGNPTLNNLAFPGRVKIFVRILNQDDCFVGRKTIEFHVDPSPDLTPIVSSNIGTNQFCESDNVFPLTLFADVPQFCGQLLDIFWEGPNGFQNFGATVSVNEIGTYLITAIDEQNNVGEITYTLSYLAEPQIAYVGPTQLCPSNDLQDILNAEPPGGTWSGDGVEINQFFGPTPGDYVVTYEWDDPNGCGASEDFTIEVTLNPDVSVDAPDFVCISDFEQDVLLANPPGGTYDPSPILVNNKILATMPGTYTLTYRYGDPNSACNESYTFDITVVDVPIVNITSTVTEVCLNSGPQDILVVNPLGGEFVSNNVDVDGNFQSNILGGNIVEYEYTDPATGCSNFAVLEIDVIDGDILEITDPGQLCQGSAPVQIEALPSGGIFIGANITSDGLYSPDELGPDEIQYNYTNAQGCESTSFAIVEVIVGTNIAVMHPETVCLNQGPVTINVFPLGGTFSGNINQNGIFEPNQIGVNDLVYSYENTQGCITDYNFSIEVLDYVIPQIASLPNPVCFSQSDVYQLIAEPAGGVFFGNVSTSGEFIPNQLGTNTIGYGPGPDNECIISTTIDIEVIPELNVFVEHPMSLCRNSIPYDVLVPNIPGGTWEGPVTPDGRFQAFDFGFNEVIYTVDDPVTGCNGSYTFEIEVVETSELAMPQFLNPAEDEYCIYEIVELCIDPVVDAVGYRWETNFGIIEYATPNQLCVRIGWNALVADEICIYPIGECGISLNPLCHPVEIIDDVTCVIINTGTSDLSEEKVNIYPNPTVYKIHIEANVTIKKVAVYSAIGKLIRKDVVNELSKLEYAVDELSAGIYFIQVNDRHLEKVIVLD